MFVVTNKGLDAQGKPTGNSFTAKYDGKEYPYASMNSPTLNTIAYKRLPNGDVEYTIKFGGMVSTVATRTVSKDGRTMTEHVKSTNAQGQTNTIVRIYEKQ